MIRLFLTAVLLAAFTISAHADESIIQLKVRPMPAPKPALKYQLLPELSELNSGNPSQNYLKCFMEQRTFFYGNPAVADRARYLAMPLAELPLKELENYGGNALRQADWAARLDALDWQAIPRIQNGGIDVVPGELGPIQILAAALQVRFRAEVAGRHYDRALRTAKTMFALAHHLGQHPTIVANLIGLSVAHLGLSTVEEMVQQPGCPNLYWALTDLPTPLVDLRVGLQGDRTLVAAELGRLRCDAPMEAAELEAFVSRVSGVLSFAREQAGRPPRSLRASLSARAKDHEKMSAARRRLVAAGCAKDLVAKLAPLQVILVDDKNDYEIEHDERAKLLSLPLWEAQALCCGAGPDPGRDAVFTDLLPDVLKLRRSQEKLGQQIAVLRLVEAMRLYAAAHEGKFPTSLSEFSVPLPADPFTGKPFVYAVEGASAHISRDATSGGDKSSQDAVHYVVTLEK
jgi:hypothetical protein